MGVAGGRQRDVDLDAWFAQAVAGVDGVQVPQGAADAGVMLAGGADGEFVATESTAFLGPDAGDDAAGAGGAGSVARGNDFAGFLPDYTEGAGSVTLGRWWARWWGILPNPVRAGWGGSVWRCGVRG